MNVEIPKNKMSSDVLKKRCAITLEFLEHQVVNDSLKTHTRRQKLFLAYRMNLSRTSFKLKRLKRLSTGRYRNWEQKSQIYQMKSRFSMMDVAPVV